jgi:hypothetical protein
MANFPILIELSCGIFFIEIGILRPNLIYNAFYALL